MNTAKITTQYNVKKTFKLITIMLSLFMLIAFYDINRGDFTIYIGKYAVLGIFVFMVYRYSLSNKINYAKLIIFSSLLTFISILHLLNDEELAQNEYLSSIENTLIYIVVGVLGVFLFSKINHVHFRSILMIFFMVIMFTVTIPSILSLNDSLHYINHGGRMRYLGLFHNPNELGKFSMLGILLAFRLWGLYKGVIKKGLFLFATIANVYILYLSDSRAAMVVTSLAFIFWVLILLYRKIPFILFISIFLLITSIFLFCLLLLLNFTSFAWSLDWNELSSGRIAIWASLFDVNAQGVLFGSGPTDGKGVHNGYLEIFRYFGLVGLMTWMIIIFYLLKLKIKSTYDRNNISSLMGISIVILFLMYHLFEGALVSVGNLASVYFWLELSQRYYIE